MDSNPLPTGFPYTPVQMSKARSLEFVMIF